MPIYEYKCEFCQHQVEVLQKINDAPLRLCPSCNKESLSKMVTAAAFKLKGTGWYETDFKNKQTKGNDKKSSVEKTKATTDNKNTPQKKQQSKKIDSN